MVAARRSGAVGLWRGHHKLLIINLIYEEKEYEKTYNSGKLEDEQDA
jgi:hypothetical protein